MNNNSKHEINKIEYYKNKGYTASYHLINNKLIDVDTKKEYTVKDVTIDEEYRYEGYSNPADLSILYILTMHDGTKGTILAAYGPSANICLLYTSPSPRDRTRSRMPSSA
eukprot:TRINITY_DN158_c0_g1_i9.p1 TRINITY_DN158_c0_g1~~TRINITY_DN158_c0_g1_i9.p1  ORF type:complete len:110 (-),score=11.39 TRINITY_DN158_c0_g1_i9:8-337(-)